MILGVDHLAVSCDDIASAAAGLNGAGYDTAFIEPDLTNADEKRAFLHQFESRHGIALCRHRLGISIEWTCHGTLYPACSAYEVLLDHPLASSGTEEVRDAEDLDFPQIWHDAGLTHRAPWHATVPWLGRCGMMEPTGEGATMGIRALAIRASDIEQSRRFWMEGIGASMVGFGKRPLGRSWIRLNLRSPVPSWSLDLLLVESDRLTEKPMLDDRGANCLALLSTDLDTDLDRLSTIGPGGRSSAFELTVANKPLKIALVRGPAGEIVELIQPVRTNTNNPMPASVGAHNGASKDVIANH